MHRKIDTIVVHCSDSPHRGDHASDVHAWHLQRGWAGIGYHYTITEEGAVENGRPTYWVGSHVKGHNQHSLGIMLFGVDEFTPEQFKSLQKLLNLLLLQFPGAKVVGHRDLDPYKFGPNFDVISWWDTVNEHGS